MPNIVSVSYLIDDDTPLEVVAQRYEDRAIGTVRLGGLTAPYTTIQSTSPAALRRLAAALNDAADKAEAITAAAAAAAHNLGPAGGAYAEAITEAGE